MLGEPFWNCIVLALPKGVKCPRLVEEGRLGKSFPVPFLVPFQIPHPIHDRCLQGIIVLLDVLLDQLHDFRCSAEHHRRVPSISAESREILLLALVDHVHQERGGIWPHLLTPAPFRVGLRVAQERLPQNPLEDFRGLCQVHGQPLFVEALHATEDTKRRLALFEPRKGIIPTAQDAHRLYGSVDWEGKLAVSVELQSRIKFLQQRMLLFRKRGERRLLTASHHG